MIETIQEIISTVATALTEVFEAVVGSIQGGEQ